MAISERKEGTISRYTQQLRLVHDWYDSNNAEIPSDALLTGITRLSTIGSPNILTPEECLACAQEVRFSNILSVAQRHNVSTASVERAVRDASAVLIYLDGYAGDVEPSVKNRIERLEIIESQLARGREIVDGTQVQPILSRIPHINKLVNYYLEYRTVRPLLDELGVPYTTYQLRSVPRFIFSESVDDSLDGITPLAQRFLFAVWEKTAQTIHSSAESRISEAASFLLTADISQQTPANVARIRDMRVFLIEMMNQEYGNLMGVPLLRDEFVQSFFPNSKGEPADSIAELSVVGAYRQYEAAGFCPHSIARFAGNVARNVPLEQRVNNLRKNEKVSYKRRREIEWAGKVFLERILSRCGRKDGKPRVEDFTINTLDLLKKVKQKMLNAAATSDQAYQYTD